MQIGLVYDSQNDYTPDSSDPEDENAEYSYDYEIENLSQTIESLGHELIDIGDLKKLVDFLSSDKAVDLIFNYAVGKSGSTREAQVPALLEGLKIPYTGADAFSLSVGNDKALCKKVWQNAGLPTGDFWVILQPEDIEEVLATHPEFPLFIKPVREGSSKGLRLADSEKELRENMIRILHAYRQPVLIESFLPGREFTVGVIGSDHDASSLGVVELLSDSKLYRDYKEKKRRKQTDKTFLAVEPASLRNQLLDLGLQAYRAIGCQVIGRVDIRMDKENNPVLMEINANPALKSQDSAMPAAAHTAGITYQELIEKIINLSIERWSL